LFVPLALLLLGISGCNGGGGADAAPTAVADSYVVNNPGDTLSVSAPGVLQNDSGSGLTAQLVSYSGPGTLTLNSNGSFAYTDNTVTSFTYRAVNGTGSSAPVTVTIGINQPPVANYACTNTPAGTPIGNGTLTASDPENKTLTYSLETQAAKGDVQVFSDGRFTYVPNTNLPAADGLARGMDQFTFRVTDSLGTGASGAGTSATGVVTVFIDGSLRFMPLGDSITAGYEGGTFASEVYWVGYRRKLYNDLTALYQPQFGINFVGTVTNLGASANPPLADRDNEGHDGWRDNEILNGSPTSNPTCPTCNITDWLNSTQPDIVLLHIGTNGINDTGGTSSTDVAAILDKIKAWESANSSPVTVFLARIIGSPDAPTNTNVTTFNNNVASMAQARINGGDKIVIVNQQTGAGLNYSGLGAADGSSSGPDMGDNLHPNMDGYEKMADRWKTDLVGSAALPTCP